MKSLITRHALFIICILLFFPSAQAADRLKTANLRVEYKTSPVGIDTERPRFSWEIISDKYNTMQTAYEIRSALEYDDLEIKDRWFWHVKKENGRSIHVEYSGQDLESRQRLYWQVRIWDNHGRVSDWSETAFWEMGLLKEEDWEALWIQADIDEDPAASQPAHYFRRSFNLKKPVKSARLYITSHGLYESFVNGKRVGDQVFTPGWTSYNKRLQYQVYDVTGLLETGRNAAGIILGDGWFRGYLGWSDRRNVYGSELAVLAQLEVFYKDGTSEMITTDGQWKAMNDGPIRLSDIYNGEKYDARKEMPGWAEPGFNDQNWKKAVQKQHPKNHLTASYGHPVRRIEEIKPVKRIDKENGTTLFDMGQNMVGWVRLSLRSPRPGKEIKLRHAETLDKQGNLYTENLRSAKQTVQYIARGDKEEVYEPHFTFKGFRYVELSGINGNPDSVFVTGIVIHSDMAPTGEFYCSDPLINQLQSNILWGMKGNFLDVPTDCPQRDEKLGWTGDAQVFAPTACFNMDAASFFTKWLKDLALDQAPDGKVVDVVPDVLAGGGGHAGWGDAAVIVPWTLYLNYGDKRILEEQYESMKSWTGYMSKRAGEDYLWTNDWHYGDWLSFDDSSPSYMGAYTETDLIATAFFAWSSTLMHRIADILGRQDDAAFFGGLAEKIKSAFIHEFMTPGVRLVSHTQTAYTLALAFDLLPEEYRERAAAHLNQNVRRFGHITTGFLGTPHICQVLSDFGYLDTAYMLLNRKQYPSWLYPVSMGATTIWERWDGIKPDSTFQDAGMNSLNHYAYGAIGKWLYSTVAGIDTDENEPGYKHIIIAPRPGGGLTHAGAGIKTMYGMAAVHWELQDSILDMDVTIPPNTKASVYLPVQSPDQVQMNGKKLAETPEWKLKSKHPSKPVITIGSGRTSFKCSGYVPELSGDYLPLYHKDPGNKGEEMGWADFGFDDSRWQDFPVPGFWEYHPEMQIDGAVWFRKAVDIPDDWSGKPLHLSIGAIDDFDVTYFNGIQVGATGEDTPNFWIHPRHYTVPAHLVKPGRAWIAVRVFDHFGEGGFAGPAADMRLCPADGSSEDFIKLDGLWKMKVELALDPSKR